MIWKWQGFRRFFSQQGGELIELCIRRTKEVPLKSPGLPDGIYDKWIIPSN